MNFKKKLLPLSLVLASVLLLSSCSKKEEDNKVKSQVKKTIVDTLSIKKQTYPIWVDFSGKTQAYEEVALLSIASGELKEILFKAGQDVKKGDILFKIDDREIRSILAQKRATLAKDQASLNLASTSVNRYTPLVNKGLAPRSKLDELEAALKQNKATVSADKEAIRQAQIDLEFTRVKASISGQIGKALVDKGNIITASQTVLANIINAKKLYVNFNPSAREVSLIRKYSSEKNLRVLIQPENSNENLQLEGYIDFIDNTSNESTGTVAMRAKIENHKSILFPGTFVEIKLFVTDKLEVIALNPNTISHNQLGSYVLVVNENNKIETRQLEISFSNKTLSIVKNGLKDGDRVILSSITRLREGQEVQINEVSNNIKE